MARPREFDEEKAVENAMNLFWERGFDGTSLDSLESSTGLNRSSLYNAFGGKLKVFCRALDVYSNGPCRQLLRPLRQERGADALRGFIAALRAFVRSRNASRGCMMMNTSLEPELDETVRHKVDRHFRLLRAGFDRAYAAGLEDGTVNDVLSHKEAADWLLTFVRGVLASAASGESGAVLDRTLDTTTRQLGLK